MKNNKSTIRVNYLFNTAYQLLTILVPIITGPYIARKLGAANIGHYSHITSIVNYFILLANFGTYTYGRREIASKQKAQEKYSEAFWNVLFAKGLTGIFAISIYVVFLLHIREYSTLYIIELMMLLSQILDISWFYQGLENYKLTVICQTVTRILGIIAILLFISEPNDIAKYTFIMSCLPFLGTIGMYFFLPGYVRKPKLDLRKIKETIVASGTLFIPQIATSLYMLIDKTMIGLFFKDGVQGGLYEQATKIDQMGLYVVISLTAVMIPRLSLYYNENDNNSLKESTSTAIKYIMFVGCPLAFGMSGVGFNVLPWLLGPGYDGTGNILQITAFISLIMGITNYLGYGYLVATRQHKRYTLTVFVGTFVNLIINFVLIPIHGAIGAAIASLASETFVLVIQVFLLYRELDLKNAFSGTIRYFCTAAFMGIIVRFMSMHFQATIVHSLIIIITGVALYVLPLFILKDFYMMRFFNKIRDKLTHTKDRRA